jgi:hypothetical protein
MMQGVKLKEISAKAAGKEKKPRFGQRRRPAAARREDAED